MSKTTKDVIKQLQQELEKYKSEIYRLKSIIDHLPGCIYWKNEKGVYLGRNQSSAESLKNMGFLWRKEEVIGKTDYDLFPKEMADQFRKHDLQIMATGKASSHEETVSLANKTIIQLSTKAPFYDAKDNIAGTVGNTIDITYLKEIEIELREAKDKAEMSTKLKTAFIRNMKHDIRTPFSGIYSIASALAEQETERNKKKFLTAIANCAKELLDYCNSILDFAKIETGVLPLIAKKFDLKKLITSIIAIETPPAEAKQLSLLSEYANDVPIIVIGDYYRLQRILINLTSNAIKFTQKGHIKIGVKLAKKLDNKNLILRFKVEDTGIGISKEMQLNVYEKFNRLNPSNQGIYKGAGLGLSIVKQFIGEMGGEIDLRSDAIIGSTFICTLPFELPLIDDIPEEANYG